MYYIRNKLRDYVFAYRNQIGKLQPDGRYLKRPSWGGDRLVLIWDLGRREFTSEVTYHWCKSNSKVYLEVDIWESIDSMYGKFRQAYRDQLGHNITD